MKARAFFITAALLIGVGFVECAASEGKPVILKPDQDFYLIGLYLDILDDPERKLTIEEVSSSHWADRFRPSKHRVPNFAFSSSCHWLRFSVINRAGTDRAWVLEFQAPTVDHVDLFERGTSGGFSFRAAGDAVPMKDWEIQCRHPAFRLHIPPGGIRTFFLRVEGTGLIRARLVVSDEKAFFARERRSSILFALFMGGVGIVILYNLMFWVTLRERIYLYYVLSTLFIGLVITAFTGRAYLYCWPNSPVWASLSLAIFSGLMLFWTILFTREFLKSKEFTPYLDYFAQLIAAAGLLVTVLCLFYYRLATAVLIFSLAAGVCLFFLIAVKGLVRRFRYAAYYLVSYLVFFLGLTHGILAMVGIIPVTGFGIEGMTIGLPITLLVLSLAMADRFMHLQRQYGQVLEEEVSQRTEELDDALAQLAVSRDELELRVEERTAELSETTEKLKQERDRSKQAHETLERELEKFEALYELAVAMTAQQGLDENLALVVQTSRRLLGADTSFIALRDDAEGDVCMHTLSGITTEEFKKIRIPFGYGLGGKVAETGKGYIVQDYFQEVEKPFAPDMVSLERLISGIAVPLQISRQNLGVLYVFNRERTSFPESDLTTLSLLGNLAAVEITRNRAEEALRQSRSEYQRLYEDSNRNAELYQTLLDVSPDPIVVYDAVGAPTYINPAFSSVFGWTHDELRGKKIDYVPPENWPETKQMIDDVLAGRHFSSRETRRYTKDGRTIDVSISAAIFFSPEGQTAGSVIYLRDITEQKRAQLELRQAHDELELRVEQRTTELAQTNEALDKALEDLAKSYEVLEQRVEERTSELAESNELLRKEIAERERAERMLEEAHFQLEESARACFVSEQRFRTVFEAAEDCMFLKDMEMNYVLANPYMLHLLGENPESMLTREDSDLFGDDYARHARELEQRVLAGDTVESEHLITVRGVPYKFNCIRFPMQDSSGKVVGLCGIGRDVTERRRAEGDAWEIYSKYPSAAMARTAVLIDRVCKGDSLVLFLGESGSGKDYWARYLHENSVRAGGPFIGINCAALPAELVESELFGHEAGAFTGAIARKRGLLELADGGTALLNEIGDMPLPVQVKLLTFLDSHSFTRLGSQKTTQVNTRIVAATNRDLRTMVDNGEFREDLFHRLNVFPIRIPSLRERKDDLIMLGQEILEMLASSMALPGVPRIDPLAHDALLRYEWPGNVRELRNVLERALIIGDQRTVRAGDLADLSQESWASSDEENPDEMAFTIRVSEEVSIQDAVQNARRFFVSHALDRFDQNVSAAARFLGVSRATLRHYLKSLALE